MRNNSNANIAPRCRLLELPAELREQIWNFAVSDWVPIDPNEAPEADSRAWLCRGPIRIDRFNHRPPAAITAASSQTRSETLHLYYSLNTFECWRPRFRSKLWMHSSLVNWLQFLGPEKRLWLQRVVLLYKSDDELATDVEADLAAIGLPIGQGTIRHQLQLTEYERCFEQLGLPRHFGRKRSCR